MSAPQLSLPKGGGAIRGMGEKFGANPVTGTGTMSVPIFASPGRAGFGPQLSLSYDSGAGNGPFALGWRHSVTSISRKTDKGLPLFRDDHRDTGRPDVFMLSGHEDLVPALVQSPGGEWKLEVIPPRIVGGATYRIERFRPRVEGLFSRIERWTCESTSGDVFWRSITKDNITSWYGKTVNSRIVDPKDATRIFTWLICETHDDKGNAMAYEYKEENSDSIDLLQVHERNRTAQTRGANRYLKRIRYGNRTPWFPELTPASAWPALPAANQWHFELVFDYGEHDTSTTTPETETRKWPVRADPFSSRRSCFEVRTYRLCQRVLMFHRFAELGSTPCLVASTDFTHHAAPLASYLKSVAHSGYTRQANGTYVRKSTPPLEFTYSESEVDEATPVRTLDRDSGISLPEGVDGARYAFVDLDGEGLSGILTQQGGGWLYKRNLSPLAQVEEDGHSVTMARFAPAQDVATFPALAMTPGSKQMFRDLAGDGALDVVNFHGPNPGFHERTPDRNWDAFIPFRSLPNVAWNDPHLRFIDLTGDGLADLAITEDHALLWHPSLAENGFGAANIVQHALDEEAGPRCVFGEAEQSIFLADMSGDGLADIVRIRYGEVC
ncbi:SpvB/TcaC N-terminal domain-containing protein [Variovorax sp. J22R133]|uniref:SpvB/TcaC N-terminal domain-containing protein n=1 Tax=Variovorax brevis TaxID=3053503 RepID=UPI002578FE5E|nr:SpvB/TcaC N-terminal domain-containing protein [Variovorax sp. J22R133]MDM0118027.1 SpvB/TcaC N-terminal domain-containing protein [Variovorax sp. J22R133]